MENIGYKLKTARESKRYSQEYVADCLKVSPSTISRIENHCRDVRFGLILDYCKILEISSNDILSEYESAQKGENQTNNFMYSINIHIKDMKTLSIIQKALSNIKID